MDLFGFEKTPVMTSYYANVRNLPSDITTIGISVGACRFVQVDRRELRLAPTRDMLRLPPHVYNQRFEKLLSELDPKEVYESLGEDCVLLCFERPGESCHRRLVAEWFEQSLGVEVTEYGFNRDEVPPYLSLKWR